MNKIDNISRNRQSLSDKVSGGRTDIDGLLKSLNDVNNRLDIIERILNAKKQVVNGHTSEMPDYKGDNRDHDARYATKKSVASSSHIRLHALDSTDDHSSSIPRYHLMMADANGLPSDGKIYLDLTETNEKLQLKIETPSHNILTFVLEDPDEV